MIDKGYLLGERYRIIDILGEGGMANVYLAEDIILQRKVAVKLLRLDLRKEPQTESRFQREALATSELSHPNIVSVLDVGTDQGLPYMVMEYVDGPDLKDYIRENSPLDLDEVIRIMDQILSAVALAHKHNVIHRDLKPQNILMDQRGNVKIADFGIAVALNQSSITQTNAVMGSVHYMSPEQTRGGLVTAQSDIYSLGIILYELITGTVPFSGETPVSVALKHAQEPIPSIRRKDKKVPQALENVVLKATSKDPRDRYASAQAMQADLDTSLELSRRDEPIFKPQYGLKNDDPTIVLSDINAKNKPKADSKAPKTQEKVPFWQNVRKHWLWFVFIGIAAVLIVSIMAFALTGKNTTVVRIPDVTNMTEGKARTKLEKAGLVAGKIQHKESDSIDAGKVISTNPSAGSTVKKGRSVDLVVSKGAGMVKVPDVTGMDYEDAVNKLEKLGFSVIRENQNSTTVPEDEVISQSVAAGVEVKPSQTTITLVVSQGDNKEDDKDTIKLKDLTGETLSSAQEYAEKNDLTLQITQDYSDTVEKDHIISMKPEAGTEVHPGSTITITVSKGKADEVTTEITKTFTVNYVDNNSSEDIDKDADDSSQSSDNLGNHIQIYIKDDNHSLSNIYRDLYIHDDMNFSIPFYLKNGSGQLKVIRDGETILNEKVTK
ncbi:non-specific serine threonine protein kinase [Lactobacillus pasteurii DSM 23907 = CRBIP 24.76]|uniref:non-specific serine/threonine protein kinase n=1 Tax=Lactobacillus pasteurii DSM 23907 = CRBIP 24.76 TaxID=1423790 RepID=I7LEF5_9LACO|nr:Stk1 family PASTA domain-containing Ser/Thr kinase [Lactobacillus pasteurii]KRK08405.1 non-specific serine threonine protein kinase [Lactobacillus pasteurii DSM 23907 = CRBIP 24.76]TDG75583.1 hypothetical protein C5L33_000468 [Lactobacillus pasteurii]CCI85738.1 Possible non-specific serine/threonine protein kinase [Lactobacillus pasteurii DSM 23907 = CRBIP 24.76]